MACSLTPRSPIVIHTFPPSTRDPLRCEAPWWRPQQTGKGNQMTTTNRQRAEFAAGAFREFQSITGTTWEDGLGDLLCDLMHFADAYNFHFDAALDRARGNYDEEFSEEKPTTPTPMPYMATFNTPAGWVTEIFRTSSPAEALRAAQKYNEGPSFSSEDLEPIAEGYCVREIVITDPDERRHQLAVWRTEEYRVQLAAPNLLEALESVMHWWKSTAHTDDDEMPADLFDQAHAIIAQAKGGAA